MQGVSYKFKSQDKNTGGDLKCSMSLPFLSYSSLCLISIVESKDPSYFGTYFIIKWKCLLN